MTTLKDEDLIGYLADALEPDERAAVESYLRMNPAAAGRLDELRRLLAPFEVDRDSTPAPSGLAERTLARLAAVFAEHEPPAAPPRPLPRAPREEPESRAVGGRLRPDLLVACGIAIVAGGLIFSAVGKVRARYDVAACQNTLRVTHVGLSGYADAHSDRYPQIGPDSTADSFGAMLASSGQVPPNFRPVCPACPTPSPTATVPAAGYTYTLGYRLPGGELTGFRRPGGSPSEHDLVPISADYPAAAAAPAAGPLCPHSSGMNVLYCGGNVRLTTTPNVGPNRDHIFQNIFGSVGAGAHREDVVLGRPGDRP
jgi:prepilin-type processing-associated H-X9-DG protein